MNVNDLISRVEQLIDQGEAVLATRHRDQQSYEWINSGKMAGFRSGSLSFIERVYGKDHSHYIEFSKSTYGSFATNADEGIAILNSIRDEMSGGWLISVKGLVAAELFADFIEMADHLLARGYKDPAAVMVGSVLEEHIRQLCEKNDIPINAFKNDKEVHIKVDRLNADLCKAEVYSKLDQKSVTAWLDLRNNAAHGKYDAYNQGQVLNMASGVTEFMARIHI